jgi:hypothetical protein
MEVINGGFFVEVLHNNKYIECKVLNFNRSRFTLLLDNGSIIRLDPSLVKLIK